MKGPLRAWLLRIANTGRPENSEMAEELAANLQLHIDDNVRRGMSPQEARREALMKLGGIESAKEAYRDQRSVPFLENLIHDTRYAFRQLRKNPGFTSTAVLILSLGMCASVAIFAFVYAALLEPLPYRDPATLVGVFETAQSCPVCNLSYPDYLDWKAQTQTLGQLEGYRNAGFSLVTPSGLEPVRGARVSAGFFRLLGVSPVAGRDFHAAEDKPGTALTALITHEAWQRRFGGRQDIVGQRVVMNDLSTEIIGVLPKGFHFALLGTPEFYQILVPKGSCEERRGCHGMYGVGRLKPGVALPTAVAELVQIANRLEQLYPESNRGQGGYAEALSESISGRIRPILLTLFGGACLLLVIVWANVASLLLVRAEGRKREMSVRRALGASALRLVSQFITEGLALVLVSSATGLLLAHWLIQGLLAMIPQFMLVQMPYFAGVRMSGPVFVFAGLIALVAATVVASTPALHLLLSKTSEGLAEGSRGTAGLAWRRLGSKLVMVELATAVILLVGAGLLGKSLYALLQVDLGFQPGGLLAVELDAPPKVYDTPDKLLALHLELKSRLASLPGVTSVAFGAQPLVSHQGNTTWLHTVGQPNDGSKIDLPTRAVSPEYFATVGARLGSGRYFRETDDAQHPKVVMVNRTFAKLHFPNQEAVGKQVIYHRPNSKPMEIVGVVEDLREGQLDSGERAFLYVPVRQQPDTFMVVNVRTQHASETLIPAINAQIREVNRNIVIYESSTLTHRIQNSRSAYMHRSAAWLTGGFAALALMLSVIGLYGVVAYSVSQRTREIGVRMALGAARSTVTGLILKEAGWLCGAGLAIGLLCSVGFATFMSSMLFGVKSWDIATLAVVAAVLGAAALLASYIPAHRAASVNPIEALRAE